jgi:hypothetical protein
MGKKEKVEEEELEIPSEEGDEYDTIFVSRTGLEYGAEISLLIGGELSDEEIDGIVEGFQNFKKSYTERYAQMEGLDVLYLGGKRKLTPKELLWRDEAFAALDAEKKTLA